MINVLVEIKNGVVVLFSKHYTIDEAKELHRQLGNFLASYEAAQQSVHPTKAIRCACGGEMLANYRCQSCGLASPL